MTVLALAHEKDGPRWTPLIDPARYERRATLNRRERWAVGLLEARPSRWLRGVGDAVARLLVPINDVLDVAGCHTSHGWARPSTRGELFAATSREQSAFWGWDRATGADGRGVRRGRPSVRDRYCLPVRGVHGSALGDPRV